jgi:hypothetical protein
MVKERACSVHSEWERPVEMCGIVVGHVAALLSGAAKELWQRNVDFASARQKVGRVY